MGKQYNHYLPTKIKKKNLQKHAKYVKYVNLPSGKPTYQREIPIFNQEKTPKHHLWLSWGFRPIIGHVSEKFHQKFAVKRKPSSLGNS